MTPSPPGAPHRHRWRVDRFAEGQPRQQQRGPRREDGGYGSTCRQGTRRQRRRQRDRASSRPIASRARALRLSAPIASSTPSVERTLQADLADESLRSTENGSSTDKRILRRRWTRFWYSRVAWIVGLGEQARPVLLLIRMLRRLGHGGRKRCRRRRRLRRSVLPRTRGNQEVPALRGRDRTCGPGSSMRPRSDCPTAPRGRYNPRRRSRRTGRRSERPMPSRGSR